MKFIAFSACLTLATAFSPGNGQRLSSQLSATVEKASLIPPMVDATATQSIYDSNVQTTYGYVTKTNILSQNLFLVYFINVFLSTQTADTLLRSLLAKAVSYLQQMAKII